MGNDINEILYKHLSHKLNGSKLRAGKHKDIIGIENLDKVIDILEKSDNKKDLSKYTTNNF